MQINFYNLFNENSMKGKKAESNNSNHSRNYKKMLKIWISEGKDT